MKISLIFMRNILFLFPSSVYKISWIRIKQSVIKGRKQKIHFFITCQSAILKENFNRKWFYVYYLSLRHSMSFLRFIMKKDKAKVRFFVKLRREVWRLLCRKSRFLSIVGKSGLSFQRAGRGSLTTAEKLKIIRSLHQALIFRRAIMCSCRTD